ncbi:MAG: thioredoxin family protein, partial [Candidatus Aenigmarchaeota archaeon]
LILLLAVMVIIAFSGCINQEPPEPPGGYECDNQTDGDQLIMITDGMVIDQNVCEARGVKDKIMVFHSPGCPACAIAVPILEELENETDYEFEFIDVSDGRERMMEIGLIPAKIPTVVIKCKVHVGARSKEEYRSLIEG